MNAIVAAGAGNSLMPTSLEGAMRLAEMMARGKMMPEHLQGSPGDCLMVVEQAVRWGMSPFAVAQCTSVIQKKLMFEGKLVAAALHTSGIMSSRLDYEFTGSGDGRAIIVRGTLRGETKSREFPLSLKEAKTTNGMWVKQPDQQLVYAGTRGWARRHAPEVMLGVYSPEEFERTPAADSFTGTTIDGEVGTGQPRDTARAIGDELPPSALDATPQPKRQTISEWLDGLEARLEAAQTADAVDAVVSDPQVQKALDSLRNGALDSLKSIIRAAQDRTAPPAPADDADDFPGVVTRDAA